MIDNFVYVNGGGTGTLIRKEVTANGTYHAEDDNADGYSDVTVQVPDPTMINEKTVEDNGTYTASDEDAYGYKKVIVDLPLDSKSITANGTYNASGDSLKGYSSVSVNVPVPNLTALSVTENGTYYPTSGTAYNEVEVQVPQQTIMQRKNITTNGLYTASTDDNVDGYGEVYVNVPLTPLDNLSVTENGTYNPTSGHGFGTVTVDVTGSGEVKNPNYNWWTNADETLIVREDTSDPAHTTYRWYFIDFNFTDYYMPIPTELARFVPSSGVGCCGWCEDWYDPDEHPEREPNCVVGFYSNTIRMWSIGLGSNMLGTCNMCIVESTDRGISDQVYHGWIEPTFDPING